MSSIDFAENLHIVIFHSTIISDVIFSNEYLHSFRMISPCDSAPKYNFIAALYLVLMIFYC
jgi:hypothetical protein